ncbi:hypothetical protein [Nocardia sp. AG03]|uniref:hypothetical protein n=1 Tax=Nocardia sp. AG03 TaxID=3025312 RepID=UPI00241819F6|nr:hypothetical protein [Nocardia sp. AG03]
MTPTPVARNAVSRVATLIPAALAVAAMMYPSYRPIAIPAALAVARRSAYSAASAGPKAAHDRRTTA